MKMFQTALLATFAVKEPREVAVVDLLERLLGDTSFGTYFLEARACLQLGEHFIEREGHFALSPLRVPQAS